ncbi:CRISPR-associated endonuclease Cas2 [candidate division NPL-UPA2 bacterium]|nr:CRISPR-associated endonuclease Cas2 [candidate division NPL-UPA2 bacterium]
MFTVVSYDISSDKRRNKVSNILEGYGDRAQFSVFECNLNKNQFKKLKLKLHGIINAEEDNLRFYQICEGCFTKIRIFGNIPVNREPGYYLV